MRSRCEAEGPEGRGCERLTAEQLNARKMRRKCDGKCGECVAAFASRSSGSGSGSGKSVARNESAKDDRPLQSAQRRRTTRVQQRLTAFTARRTGRAVSAAQRSGRGGGKGHDSGVTTRTKESGATDKRTLTHTRSYALVHAHTHAHNRARATHTQWCAPAAAVAGQRQRADAEAGVGRRTAGACARDGVESGWRAVRGAVRGRSANANMRNAKGECSQQRAAERIRAHQQSAELCGTSSS